MPVAPRDLKIQPLNLPGAAMQNAEPIRLNQDSLTMALPADYIGPVTLPGNGRMVYWTGRVAIGLRHQPHQFCNPTGQSALWIQGLLLAA
jgi:hypothetical protein